MDNGKLKKSIRFKPSQDEIDECENDGKIKLMENGKWKIENNSPIIFNSQLSTFNYKDWEEKKLGEVAEITKGKQLNKTELEETGTYPTINGGIEPSSYTEDWNTSEDTITISEGGNSCGYVNYIKTKFWSGGHCYSLLNLKETIDNTFLYQSLKYYQNRIMRLRVGSGLPNIQKGDISNLKFIIPKSLPEQQKIANFLSSIDKSILSISNKGYCKRCSFDMEK